MNNDCPPAISQEIAGGNEATDQKLHAEVTDNELNDAAITVLNNINPTSVANDSEIAGFILLTKDGNLESRITDVQSCQSGAACASDSLKNADSQTPEGAILMGIFHTHGAAPTSNPNAFSTFSSGDIRTTNNLGNSGKYPAFRANFLATPQGQGLRKNPGPTPVVPIGPVNN